MGGSVSVVMPAHNEAAVIGRTLRRIVATDRDARLEIIVVPNACDDDTADVAAAVSDRVRVREIATPGKIAALNTGDAVASALPRAYIDADVDIDADAILAVADRLGVDGPPFIGAPRMTVDARASSLAVRCYYAVWALSDYRTVAMVGSGVYIVSAAGRTRWDTFPDVIADDLYAQRLFTAADRIELDTVTFTIRAPRTFRSFLERQTRIVQGSHELGRQFPSLHHEGGGASLMAHAWRLLRRPWLWPAAGVYLYASVVPRRRARRLRKLGHHQTWNRDESTRIVGAEA